MIVPIHCGSIFTEKWYQGLRSELARICSAFACAALRALASAKAEGQAKGQGQRAYYRCEQRLNDRWRDLQLVERHQSRKAYDSAAHNVGDDTGIAGAPGRKSAAHNISDKRSQQCAQEKHQHRNEDIGDITDDDLEDIADRRQSQ